MAAPIDKAALLQHIIARLSHDLEILFTAAKTAHAAATHEENIPDNKYDTLALEASYVAQGQANRAQELRQSLEAYRQLDPTAGGEVIRLASLVTIEAEDGSSREIFIGPREGGLKVSGGGGEVMIITPASPLGRELLGKECGDMVEVSTTAGLVQYEIVAVS